MLPLLLLGAEDWSQAPVQTLWHGPVPRKQGAGAGNPDSLVTNDLMPALSFEEEKKYLHHQISCLLTCLSGLKLELLKLVWEYH